MLHKQANMKHFCSNDPTQPVQRPPKPDISFMHHTC